jgi:hypothetical protein
LDIGLFPIPKACQNDLKENLFIYNKILLW